MKTKLVCIISISLFSSCQNEVPSFTPFEGSWKSDDGKTTEHWQAQNDSLYFGKSFSIEKNDTLLQESITIKKQSGSYYYIPQVFNQNEGREIPYKLMGYSKSQFVFENPSHDFPQRIVYDFKSENKLLVTIESLDSANTNRFEFKFDKQVH
jgi:hypothetical protein